MGLTGAKLKGKEIVAAGLATHFVPFDVSSNFVFLLTFSFLVSTDNQNKGVC